MYDEIQKNVCTNQHNPVTIILYKLKETQRFGSTVI